jgi:hypothetical protein
MSAALLEAPLRHRLSERRPTLAEVLDATWQQAREAGTADCPICHAAMHAEAGPAGPARAARCESCGTTLS